MFNFYILNNNNNYNLNNSNLLLCLFSIILLNFFVNTNQTSSFNLIDKSYKKKLYVDNNYNSNSNFISNNKINNHNNIILSDSYMLDLFLNKKFFNFHKEKIYNINLKDLNHFNFKQIIREKNYKEKTFNNNYTNLNISIKNISKITIKEENTIINKKNRKEFLNFSNSNNDINSEDDKVKKITILHDQNLSNKIDSLTKIIERMEMINNITGLINQKAKEKNGINLNDKELAKEINIKLIDNNNSTVSAEINNNIKNETISQIEIKIDEKNNIINNINLNSDLINNNNKNYIMKGKLK
jgi:hypothetical protein